MSGDVERYIDLITSVYVELSQAVSTKHVKNHLLRILLVSLDDKRLRLPLTSSRNAASLWQNGNNFSL